MHKIAVPLILAVLGALGGGSGRALRAQTPAGAPPPAAPGAECGTAHARWMQRALDGWALVSRDALALPADSLPWLLLFDVRCVWELAPRGEPAPGGRDLTAAAALRFGSAPVAVRARPHGDTLRLPSGDRVPVSPVAYASLYRDGRASFFVMALPALWSRTPEEAADPARDEFFLGVLAHEMTHTVHLAAVGRRVRAIGQRWPLPPKLGDDIIQEVFDSVPGFRQSVERERVLLAQAAAAPDRAARRRLARAALAVADARRRRYFTGARAVYAPLEDVFLLMEGVASWAAYRVALAQAPVGVTPSAVLARMETGRYWSQGLGLSLMLALDALTPEWRGRVFSDDPPSIYGLLAEAARGP